MNDSDAFEEAIANQSSYSANLARSLSLELDVFYKDLKTVGFSAVTGEGFDDFLTAVDSAVLEYENDYLPELERLTDLRQKAKQEEKSRQKKEFDEEFRAERTEPLLQSYPRGGPNADIFLRNPAVGGESSEEEEEDFRLKAEAHGSIYKDILNQNSH